MAILETDLLHPHTAEASGGVEEKKREKKKTDKPYKRLQSQSQGHVKKGLPL